VIRQRGATSWQVVVYAGRDPVTGKERHLRRTVRSAPGLKQPPKAARDLERRLLREIEAGQHRASDAATLGELLNRWLEHTEANLSPTTTAEYRRLIATRIKPELGHVALVKLTTARLDGYYRALRADLSPKTIRNVHGILRRALTQALRWGWVPTNVAVLAEPPKVTRPDIRPPSADDVRRLLAAAAERDPDFGTFCWLCAATGARRGEVAALRLADWDGETLLIERALIAVDGKLMIKGTKTDRARRIALGALTNELLKAHQDRMFARAELVGLVLDDATLLFSSPPDWRPWHPDTISSRWRRICDHVGVHARLHDLRHFVATEGLVGGVDVRTVAGRLGHANPSTTHNIYAHFVAPADQVLAAKIEELLTD
jgi:integrase